MTSTAANQLAAMAAAIKGIDEATLGASAPSNRRSLTVKHGSTRPINGGEGKYLMDSYQSSNKDVEDEDNTANIESPILDNHASAEGDTKTRARRASEGAHAAKHEGKRASGELRCEKCGKGYKHSSCLTKHLSVSLIPLGPHSFSSRCVSFAWNHKPNRRTYIKTSSWAALT